MTIRHCTLVLICLLTLSGTARAIEHGAATPDPATPDSGTPAVATEDAAAEPTPGESAVPEARQAEVQAAEAAPVPLTKAQCERLAAFQRGPLVFTSRGRVKALMMKFDRNVQYTFAPVQKGATAQSVEVTMIDRANGNKTTHGRLDVTKCGALRAHVTPLTNACNIGSIDPLTRAKLARTDEPVVTRSQIEVQGTIHAVEVTHTREGDVADDGSMRVKSVTESADGKVHTTTVTTLAPDGLPWLAETTGTIAKGPINLDVTLKLQREGVEDAASTTGE